MKTQTVVALNAVTGEANKTSGVIDLNGIYGFFLQWQVTGTPAGSIVVQASADGTTYYDVSTTTLATGFVQLDAQYYRYMKVKFARSGGVVGDTISAQVFCKGI